MYYLSQSRDCRKGPGSVHITGLLPLWRWMLNKFISTDHQRDFASGVLLLENGMDLKGKEGTLHSRCS